MEGASILRRIRLTGEAMAEASGRSSVPQIFINGTLIGGSDELFALDVRRRNSTNFSGATRLPPEEVRLGAASPRAFAG